MNQNAEYSAVNDAVRGQFLRRTWAMITPYWRSEEKGKAWLLLAVVIGLTLFSVAISVWLNHWYKDFYNALEKGHCGLLATDHLFLRHRCSGYSRRGLPPLSDPDVDHSLARVAHRKALCTLA